MTFSIVWLETQDSDINRWALNLEALTIGTKKRKTVLTRVSLMNGKTKDVEAVMKPGREITSVGLVG